MARTSAERLLLELAEADDDVGDLHAGVVDVVLDLDRPSLEAEQPAEGVAERGVAQVADVRRLVRIDRRVLDDGLPNVRAVQAVQGSAVPVSQCCSQCARSRNN